MGRDCTGGMKDLAVMNEERSVVTVGQNGLSFNVKTAVVLHQAAFVRVLLNTKTKRLRKRVPIPRLWMQQAMNIR